MSNEALIIEILKLISPVFVALIGAFAALIFNDQLKRRELIYKEKIEAFNKVSDRIFNLLRLLLIIWNPNAAEKNRTNIREVVRNLEDLENYLEFEADRYTIFFSKKTRECFRLIETELKRILDYYSNSSLSIPASSMNEEAWRDFGFEEKHTRELKDSILSCLTRSYECVNLLLTEINIPSTSAPFVVDEKWLQEREKRRIVGMIIRSD